jgi:L-fuculose-phosphate aldolase
MPAQSRSILTRHALAELARAIAARGYVAGTEGNLSMRLENGNFLLTPAATAKSDIRWDDLVEVDDVGNIIEAAAGKRPSTELGVHLACYRSNPDAHVVIHAHAPFSTAFAVACREIDARAMPELCVEFGRIPLVPYATPSTGALAEAVGRHAAGARAFLLAHHGVVVTGADSREALRRLESLEHAARILWMAESLGGARLLDAGALEDLARVAPAAYGATLPPR